MESIYNIISSKEKILILGFGREGRSTYRYFRSKFPDRTIWIADENTAITKQKEFLADKKITWKTGRECYTGLSEFDLIIKTPGIPLKKLGQVDKEIVSSQTDLFIREYYSQVIGISGTKGKSTTSSLIHHILKENGKDSMLAGNIGKPVFDLIGEINEDSIVVMELSAHQGEILHRAPSQMVLLNIFQEHLDHFGDFGNYRNAKFNFCTKQMPGDTLVYFAEDPILKDCYNTIKGVNYTSLSSSPKTGNVYFSKDILAGPGYRFSNLQCALKGRHNLINIAAAITISYSIGITQKEISSGLQSFKPLEHRLEYIGEMGKIKFYNDSISTVPEAAIAAIEALEKVKWIILGGFDRGISYDGLVDYLANNDIEILLMGDAGKRIHSLALEKSIDEERLNFYANLPLCAEHVFSCANTEGICLLSPAASSYDSYKNFEERGAHFKQLVKTFINGKA